MPKRWPKNPLSGLDDFSGFDASGAYTNALARRVDLRFHCLQIHIPAATCHVVRVRNIVAEQRLLTANFTYLCHDLYPISCKCGRGFGKYCTELRRIGTTDTTGNVNRAQATSVQKICSRSNPPRPQRALHGSMQVVYASRCKRSIQVDASGRSKHPNPGRKNEPSLHNYCESANIAKLQILNVQ